MYKCKNCGNTEKFLGIVSEKGRAFIYQERTEDGKPVNYSWIYCISDLWMSNMKVSRCFYCKSRNIIKI